MLNLETSQKHSICGLLSPFFRLQRQSITSLPLALAYSCLSLWSHGQSKASACVMRGAGRVLTQPFLHCVSFYTFPPLTCRLHVSYSALSLWLIRGLLCHPQSVLTRNRNAETSITLHLSPQMFPADVGQRYSGSRLALPCTPEMPILVRSLVSLALDSSGTCEVFSPCKREASLLGSGTFPSLLFSASVPEQTLDPVSAWCECLLVKVMCVCLWTSS